MLRLTQLLSLIILLCALPAARAETPSEAQMFKRLSALASTGNTEVQYNLGMFLNNGIGTEHDHQAAFKYFSSAAEAGHELAAYKVGCYLAGQFPGVVPVNKAEALRYKLRAAEAGYELAQLDVGIIFYQQRDIANALLWWERASRQGNAQATTYLSTYFASNSSPNKAKAYALMLSLKDSLPNPPQSLLDGIAQRAGLLSADEKSEADAIHASWLSGPSPLSIKAKAGISAVPPLLTSLEH